MRKRWRGDLLAVAAATLTSYIAARHLELYERAVRWLALYEPWQADELIIALAVFACGMAWYSARRVGEARRALQQHERSSAHVLELLAHNRELAQRLLGLQEEERRTLARELHDELGQSCSAIRVELACIRRVVAGDLDALAAVQRADGAALGLQQLVRDMLRRLRPAQLDALGLVAALQELCESWSERSGVRCVFRHEGMGHPLGEALDITVYRVVQEALTNVLRHAGASVVQVRIAREPGELLRVTVEDDGCGFDPTAPVSGFGLLGANERAAAVAGVLTLQPRAGGGMRLELAVPLRQPGAARAVAPVPPDAARVSA